MSGLNPQNDMLSVLTSDDSASNVMMFLDDGKNVIVMEGHSDLVSMENSIQGDKCRVCEPVHGMKKRAVKDIIYFINNDSSFAKCKNRVIGIVDSDFLRIYNPNLSDDKDIGLFHTDFHDFNVYFFTSKAFDKFLMQYSDGKNIEGIRDQCLLLAQLFGLMVLAMEQRKQFGFRPYLAHLINTNRRSVLERAILYHFVKREEREFVIEKGKIWRNIQEMVSKQVLSNIQQTHCERSKQKIDINQLVNGHDLTAILVKLVCSGRVVKKIGLNPLVQRQYKDYTSLTPRNIDDVLDLFQEIETDLAMAYDSTFFSETGLYKDIIEYEDKINAANTGKPIKFLKRITIS